MTSLPYLFQKFPFHPLLSTTPFQSLQAAVGAGRDASSTTYPRSSAEPADSSLPKIAVSFLPAAGETVVSPPPVAPEPDHQAYLSDEYTYHHLRRDIFDIAREAGVDVGSRYVVPSAHITLGRR